MKVGVIQFSTLKKHDRWDVAYYLGNLVEKEQAVSKAQVQLEKASTTLLNRTKDLVDEIHRSQALIKSGEVVPIDLGERMPPVK